MDLLTIKEVVARALREHIAPSMLSTLLIYEETDSDEEPVLRFQAVIDDAGPALSADKIFFATGIVRDALIARDETRFPLLTFPSSSEITGVAA